MQRIREADLTDAARRKIRKMEVGSKYGRLTIVGFAYLADRAYWTCECNCGETVAVSGHSLARGSTRSCGCLRSEVLKSYRKRAV